MVSAKFVKKRTFKGTPSWLSLKRNLKLVEEVTDLPLSAELTDLPLSAELTNSCFIYHDSNKTSDIKGNKALSYRNYKMENEKLEKEKREQEKRKQENMDIAHKMAAVAGCGPCCGCGPGGCSPCGASAPGVPPAPCGCGPCGCTCLPPPCDCQPKCLQNMLGYYYYPYGTWFCGPYHQKVCCAGGPVSACAVPGCCGCCAKPCGPCPAPPCPPPSPSPCPPCPACCMTETDKQCVSAPTTMTGCVVTKAPATAKTEELPEAPKFHPSLPQSFAFAIPEKTEEPKNTEKPNTEKPKNI